MLRTLRADNSLATCLLPARSGHGPTAVKTYRLTKELVTVALSIFVAQTCTSTPVCRSRLRNYMQREPKTAPIRYVDE
jgi:hypothetical protein